MERRIFNDARDEKGVGDPCASYDSMKETWKKIRAACDGHDAVIAYDMNKGLDTLNFSNLLIPFSPSMDITQYKFLLSEAEWPGVTSVYLRVLLGGLLRKLPKLELPESFQNKEEATNWIQHMFGEDGCSLAAFLDSAVFEELQTARAWVHVDHKVVEEEDEEALLEGSRPFARFYKAEDIINWKITDNKLSRVVIRAIEEVEVEGEFHPRLRQVVYVHEVANGKYQVRKFEKRADESEVQVVAGQRQAKTQTEHFAEGETRVVLINGEPIDFLPLWPLNGSARISQPPLTAFVNKEISLYNKTARRNHLMYTAATYTPVICSDMTDEEFQHIVDGGLGTWIHLQKGDTAAVLQTPTEALEDMEKAIAQAYDELARLGVRMLAPEAAQSGVALELRNAAQSAQLGTLNTKISSTLRAIIAFMLNWRYEAELSASDIDFSLSEDFNPVPLGADWLRLVTEWYEKGFLPRSSWLQIMKLNDILPPDYDDLEGVEEINKDELVMDRLVQDKSGSSSFDQM
jgi:hypothetical protein